MKVSVVVPHPPGYPHSAALYDLSKPLRCGLRDLGLNIVMPDEAQRIIIVGPHLFPEPPPPGAILYNTEQVSDESSWIDTPLLELYRRHRVWDYDPVNTAALRKLGVDAVTVPPGYSPSMTRVEQKPKDIDVLFFGSVNDRRTKILKRLEEKCHVRVMFGFYGPLRDDAVARAKIVLNVHFYESKIFEAARVSYLLANRAFVVTEESAHMPWRVGYVAMPYERLVETCLRYLEQPDERQRIANLGFETFSMYKAADMVRSAATEAGLV